MDTDLEAASELSEAAMTVARWFDGLSDDEKSRFGQLVRVLTSTAISDEAVGQKLPATSLRQDINRTLRLSRGGRDPRNDVEDV